MRYYILFLSFIFFNIALSANDFEKNFDNNTLRLDYTFIGNHSAQFIALDKLNKTDIWAGRKNNLDRLHLQGDGQIIVADKETNEVIYTDSFSSLFQEWQFTDEAQTTTKSFENVFLVPFPKKRVKISVSFRMKDASYKTLLEHDVDPKDILIRNSSSKHTHSTIHQGGKVEDCINVVIVPEGYTASEMDTFKKHATTTVEAIFAHHPFGEHKAKFNFFALEAPSQDSDVSLPRENAWRSTLVSSHFDTFYSDRYLTTSNVKDLHDALNGVPYSHIIILANTDTYGGGGIFNSYTLTTTGHKDFKPVVVHEFGHSFVGLADEYFYEASATAYDDLFSLQTEPWQQNITTLIDFSSKWKKLLPANTPIPTINKQLPIGVFEGGGYRAKGIYRPADVCRMRANNVKDFCPACQSAIEQIIQFYTE